MLKGEKAMNLEKKYKNADGEDCNIHQMIREELRLLYQQGEKGCDYL
jgi:hypothetical protein